MRKQILNGLLVAFVTLSFTACKNDKNATEAASDASTETVSNKVAEVNTKIKGSRYVVKSSDSSISWEGSKPLGTHTGTIAISEGVLYMQKDMITAGEFVIDMNSINVTDLEAGNGKESLEDHLKGTVDGKEGDFFNVKKYPTATFNINAVKPDNGKFMLIGDLTIKEKTNQVYIPVSIVEKDQTITMTSDEFEIDRTKWGVNYGSKSIFDNLGDKFISDEMKLKVSLVAAKQ